MSDQRHGTARHPSPARRSIRPRRLTTVEVALAQTVFGDDVDWLDAVRVVGVIGVNGRAFTLPGLGGRVYLGLGQHASAPAAASTRGYPSPGQLLIHELVHAWQVREMGAVRYLRAGVAAQYRHARGADVYSVHDASMPWTAMTIEQQATVVDRWFGGQSSPAVRPRDPRSPFRHHLETFRVRSPVRPRPATDDRSARCRASDDHA
ncbi:hypothetical protein AAFP30_23570 [Gordonia sp. CPCC 205515]|uniref:hypothetical protein n=1 Tax=Gordonia sp. CPCC 205515 TaxID=3140791 RepID=UPI003AF37A03